MKNVFMGGLLFVAPVAAPMVAWAEGSPWLINPGDTYIQVTSVEQDADEFWAGRDKTDTPGGGDVSLSTVFVSVNYGISDDLALDFRAGYAESDTAVAPSEEDFTDTTVGLTWRLHDEFLSPSNAPSVALRVAATIKGDYETNSISAIGDGASGVEASLLLGKVFNSRFALAGDIGYRYREGDVGNEVLFNMSGTYFITPALSATLAYHWVDSRANLDIGGIGFTPERFDEVEEDIESVEFSLAYALTPSVSLNLGYGSVIDGRNTVDSDVVIAGIGFSF